MEICKAFTEPVTPDVEHHSCFCHGTMRLEERKISEEEKQEIRALIGQVVLELVEEGGSKQLQDIICSLYRLSLHTDDHVIRRRCQKAIRMLADKMH